MSKKTVDETKDLATKDAAGALALAGQFAEDAGAGFEEADSGSYAIPFLKLLQFMSPQRQRASGEYVKGAEEGMFFNTVTSDLYDGEKGLLIVPCHFRRKFIEFAGTQSEGGGFVKEHSLADGERILATCQRDDDGNDRIPGTQGHILVDIREHYCVMLDPTTQAPTPILMSMGSTAIKTSKKFMSMMSALKRDPKQAAPDACFTHLYRLTAVPQTKDQFNYFGYKIEHVAGLEKAEELKDAGLVYESAKQ